MKFAKVTSLFALIALAVLSLAFASAQSVVFEFAPSSISQNAVAGQPITLNFNLNHIGGNNQTGITWSGNSPIGSFTTLPTLSQLNYNQSIPLSAVFNVPASASGTISASINVSSGSSSARATLPITLTIIQPSSNITLTATQPQPISVFTNFTLNVANTGNTILPTVRISEVSNFGMSFLPDTLSNLGSIAQPVIARFTNPSNIKFGLHDVTIKADAGTQSTTSTFQVKKTFCSNGESLISNLTIDEVSWDNNGEGDEDSWELLDEIEVTVQVQNNNNDDDVDAVVELGLFDSSGNNVADDLVYASSSDSDDEKIDINIDDDSDEEVSWVFKVPADFDTGNYRLAVKVYDDDAGQSRDCRDRSNDFSDNFFQPISIKEANDEGRFVVVDEIEMDSQTTCGQTVTGQFTVFNIGEDDQDRVKILIRNQALGVDISREITSDLNQGDDETLDFSFQVPPTASNGNYALEFITQYDYKNGVYREESEESFDAPIEVLGCSQNLGGNSGGLTNIDVDARLNSEARAGKELVVVAEIKNTGNKDETYSISARGYSDWADLTDISDARIDVDAGDTKEVTFTLLVNEDASGTQSFDIQVAQDGKVQIQKVEVELSSGASGFSLDTSNSLIWVIGAVNLVLIILIIVVAVRLSRK